MTRSRAGLLILATIWACRSAPVREDARAFAPVRLAPLTPDQLSWLEDLDARDERVTLNLTGVHAIDAGHAVVFGNVHAGGHTLRSLLLSSADGGLSWQETLAPYRASEVVFAQFLGCTGWAL